MIQTIALPEYGTSLYESKHKRGDVVKKHHHEVHQILYALEGEGEMSLDGQRLSFVQDNAALIVPFSDHAIVTGSKLTLLVLAFDSARLDAYAQQELLHGAFPTSSLLKLNAFTGGELRGLLRKMLFEQSRQDPYKSWALGLLLSELLLALARSRQFSSPTDANSLRAEKIRSYLDNRYYEPITSQDLAARLAISSRYVNTIFKEQYGTTPMQYLADVRMQVARKLLLETDKDIASICFEVGYETLSAFYRTFKQSFGLSPNQLRQMGDAGKGEEHGRPEE